MIIFKKAILLILIISCCLLFCQNSTNSNTDSITNNKLPYEIKKIKVGEIFSIKIFSENPNDIFHILAIGYIYADEQANILDVQRILGNIASIQYENSSPVEAMNWVRNNLQ